MSFDRTSQPKPKSAPTIIPASRLRARRDFELPQYPHALQRATGIGHDFSRIAVNKPFPTGQACPLSIAGPRACPFGGACHTCPPKIQAKLAVSQPGDAYEQEADRVAEAVMQSQPVQLPAAGSGPPILQRQEAAKPKSEGEKYTAAAAKVGEAFLETDLGKKLKAEAARLGKAFIGSLAGKIITGAAAVGTVTTLAATHGELPMQVPEIPLDALMPGMKVKLTYKGPVDRPTEAAISFSFTLGTGKEAEKKPGPTESEKYRAETARMAAEQEKFREGLKSPEQRAREKELFERAFWSTRTPLGLEPIKIPGLTLEPRPAERPLKKEEEILRRKAEGGSVQHTPQAIPPIVHEVLRSPGQPLDPATRAFMESRFGHNFSQVRIHDDSASNLSAKSIEARAYTYGKKIVFDRGEFNPHQDSGRRLIAHELAHVLQQGYSYSNKGLLKQITFNMLPPLLDSPKQILRNAGPSQGQTVQYVTIYLGAEYIDFHTSQGLFRYQLDVEGLEPGEYSASVKVKGNHVDFKLESQGGEFRFSFHIKPGQPNPLTFFAQQSSVMISVTNDPAPSISAPEPEREKEDDRDPNVKYLTIEEALKRCETGDLPGVKIFPYRGTRFGAAPIMAHRDGKDIIVKQPVYVLSNDDFRPQTRTLPTETFTGGVRLKPNEIVRVHTYEPRWYHLNITGSTEGDVEEEFCATGEQMLQMAERSSTRTMLNIGLTAVEGATLFIPVGRLATIIGRPVLEVAGRGGRNLAIAMMLGLRDASPTAFAGIASRTSTVVIEQQAVSQVSSRAISQTISHATIEFSERALMETAPRVAGEVVTEMGTHAATEVMARTVTVRVFDAVGHQVVSVVTTPTGDATFDAMIDQAFREAPGTAASQAGSRTAQQGVTSVAPEIAAGFSQAEVQAFRRLLARPFSHSDIRILNQLWDDAARAGDSSILNATNSRALFDLHRNRFWTRVANNPQAKEAKALFEDAGCRFSGGAPYYMLQGRRITITIDHIIERQTAPHLALTGSNLRLSFARENTVLLRLLHQLDQFQ